VFKKWVLRRTFGCNRKTGNWRKLLDEELCDFYSSPNITQVIKMKDIHGAKRSAQSDLVGNPERNRPL
jgi:hypothetical protein